MKTQSDIPAYQDRFKSVDVLSLLDPNWLENTQAAQLVHLMRQKTLETSSANSPDALSTHPAAA